MKLVIQKSIAFPRSRYIWVGGLPILAFALMIASGLVNAQGVLSPSPAAHTSGDQASGSEVDGSLAGDNVAAKTWDSLELRGPHFVQNTQKGSSLSAEPGLSPVASQNNGATPKNTYVSLPESLQKILRDGGEPETLTQLKLLESQHCRVADRVAACTVSVQIGPAQGCGVIITGTGYVLTAAHVAMRPEMNARVTLSNGRIVFAKTLGMNRNVDAGLMKIDDGQNNGRPWSHASLGKSDDLKAGMWCVAMGHPGGYDRSRGPVARVGRILHVRPGAIETDCALIGGDSGGPLFDIAGRLIAVHSRIGNDVTENLHVPIDHYDKSWEEMRSGLAYGFLPGFRPVLGVRGSKDAGHAIIELVHPGSPAARVGIQVGDEINQFGEIKITDFPSLQAAVSQTMPGERVPIWLVRQGRSIRVVVEVGRAE